MRRHELDVVSLVFGLFFIGAAVIWGVVHDRGGSGGGWAMPALLIAVGAAGLLASLTGRRSGREQPPAAPEDTPLDAPSASPDS